MPDPISSAVSRTLYEPEGASAEEIESQACLVSQSKSELTSPRVPEAPTATSSAVHQLVQQHSSLPSGKTVVEMLTNCVPQLVTTAVTCASVPETFGIGSVACFGASFALGACLAKEKAASEKLDAAEPCEEQGGVALLSTRDEVVCLPEGVKSPP